MDTRFCGSNGWLCVISSDKKTRLDVLLVERGLAATRTKARDAITRGVVAVDGTVVCKPAQAVAATASIELQQDASPYVSRAALKLLHGFDHFGIDPQGLTALDVGASTGGFTQVLLERGAAHVTALDVGHGQFDENLKRAPRLVLIERLNARDLTPEHLLEPLDLIVCDVSFISLTLALPPALELAKTGAHVLALIKPQFEAGRDLVGKGGIVRDAAVHHHVCERVEAWLGGDMGWTVLGITPSPIEGRDGNREFLIAGRKDKVDTGETGGQERTGSPASA